MAVIGELAVNVVARMSQFSKGMMRGRKDLSTFERSLERTRRSLTLFRSALAVGFALFTTGRIAASIRETAQSLDSLAKTSDKLGIASERLAGLRFGAEQSGMESRTVDMALQRMVRRIQEAAAAGQGEAVPALKALNLEASKLAKLPADRQLELIADAFKKVESDAERVRLAFKLFDSEGVNMVNLLREGSEGLQQFHREARELGIAIDRDALKKVEAFNDAMNRLSKAFGGAKQELVIDIAPAAMRAVDALTEAVKGAKLVHDNNKRHGRYSVGQFFGDLASGNTGLQRGVENYFVRRDIRRGVAMNREAPIFANQGKTYLDVAKQPGRGDRVEAMRRADQRVADARELGGGFRYLTDKGFSKLNDAIDTATKKAPELLSKITQERAKFERRAIAASFSLNLPSADDVRMRAKADKAREDRERRERLLDQAAGRFDERDGRNAALQKGSSAAFEAIRSSTKRDRILSDQLAIQKLSERHLALIAQREEDVLAIGG